MRALTFPIAGLVLLTLPGCGDLFLQSVFCTGFLDPDRCSDPPPRTTLLSADLPTDAELTALPDDYQTLFGVWNDVNTNGTVDIAPSNTATWTGSFGAEIEGGTVLTGNVDVATNFDSSSVDITLDQVSRFTGGSEIEMTGSIAANGLAVTNGRYSGTVTGTVSDPALSYEIGADLDGVFVNSGDTIGVLDGSVTNDDSSASGFLAIYGASQY
ncbi:hypothetical protein [Boseongicola aestuarii]|uniref:Transferrin-binding protein B C-lobe/N-lobe beta barrel domain-containing protein n=1 Tax=Boseongicola aestuarii TaxID=1470561 RepID=A0A238J6A2_9RHOB|nr:hypothetical protein [Boseongicola aestuarii]SMX25871.1 hypothetical protein BOA8489_04016 [Boseongicola aestuarii]